MRPDDEDLSYVGAMFVVFDVDWARSFVDAIENGQSVRPPATGWTEGSLATLAGACIAKMRALSQQRLGKDGRALEDEKLRNEFPDSDLTDADMDELREQKADEWLIMAGKVTSVFAKYAADLNAIGLQIGRLEKRFLVGAWLREDLEVQCGATEPMFRNDYADELGDGRDPSVNSRDAPDDDVQELN